MFGWGSWTQRSASLLPPDQERKARHGLDNLREQKHKKRLLSLLSFGCRVRQEWVSTTQGNKRTELQSPWTFTSSTRLSMKSIHTTLVLEVFFKKSLCITNVFIWKTWKTISPSWIWLITYCLEKTGECVMKALCVVAFTVLLLLLEDCIYYEWKHQLSPISCCRLKPGIQF